MPEKHRFTVHSTDLLLSLQDLERVEGAEMQTEPKRRDADTYRGKQDQF